MSGSIFSYWPQILLFFRFFYFMGSFDLCQPQISSVGYSWVTWFTKFWPRLDTHFSTHFHNAIMENISWSVIIPANYSIIVVITIISSAVLKHWKMFKFNNLNPHAPDLFTPSRARCAENCGSALTNRVKK